MSKRKGTPGTWEPWDGGRVWVAQDGTRTYYIRKAIGGRNYQHNTHCHEAAGAFKHLERFLADPVGYRPGGDEALYLDAELSLLFLKWSANEKQNTPKYVNDQRRYLAWWAERLKGVDLRRADLAHDILPALDHEKAKQPKIALIKGLYAWLRAERHIITTAQDPTFGQLKVPQSAPAQWKRSKVIPRESVRAVISHLASDRWRDLVRVLAGTGWHLTELGRFAAGGAIQELPRSGKAEGSVAVLVCPRHKSGGEHRTAVSREVLDAATRVLDDGAFDESKLRKSITSACKAAGIEVVHPGSFRHTVATRAVDAGADVGKVSHFLGHRSPATTARFYAALATPAKVPTDL